ncbi:MAG: pyridoxamine 5'-phosphate oxidase family protein, partial [Patescibacteria group bacterium]
VVYGRVGIDFTMLVATDRRVLYFQSKPFYSNTDEVTYDVVSGVKNSDAVLFSSVTLHTRVRDYTINYANVRCARKFVKYIEGRRIKRDISKYAVNSSAVPEPEPELSILHKDTSKEGLEFLAEHEVAVLSTVDNKGHVAGAVVYYLLVDQNIYFITRSDTTKAHNIFSHAQVGLTVIEPFSLKTVQVSGVGEVEKDASIRKNIFDQMVKPRKYKEGENYPPITKIDHGAYTVIKIIPTDVKYSDFSGK